VTSDRLQDVRVHAGVRYPRQGSVAQAVTHQAQLDQVRGQLVQFVASRSVAVGKPR
jgi:hypothetical protein